MNPEANPFETQKQAKLESATIVPFPTRSPEVSDDAAVEVHDFSLESGNGKYLLERAVERLFGTAPLHESFTQDEEDLLLTAHEMVRVLSHAEETPSIKQHCMSWLKRHEHDLNALVIRILKARD